MGLVVGRAHPNRILGRGRQPVMDRLHPRSEAGIGDGLRRRADDHDVAHRLLAAQPLLHQVDRLLRLRRADEVALSRQRVGQQRPGQHDANHRRDQPHPDRSPRMLRAPPRDTRRHTHRRPPRICFTPSTRGLSFPHTGKRCNGSHGRSRGGATGDVNRRCNLVLTRIACYRRTVHARRHGKPEPGPAAVPSGSNSTEDTMYNERRVALERPRSPLASTGHQGGRD